MSLRGRISGARLRLVAVTICLGAVLAGCESGLKDPLEEPDAKALNKDSIALYESGRFEEAIATARRALAAREQALGADHPDVTISRQYLATLYRDELRYSEAAPLDEQVLQSYDRTLPPGDRHLRLALRNLGSDYLVEGRYANAEPLFKRYAATASNVLQRDDAAYWLANLYKSWGRPGKAEAILLQDLGGDWQTAATRVSMHEPSLILLAGIYMGDNRYREAEVLLKRVFEMRGDDKDKVYGWRYESVVTQLLADLYNKTGRADAAAPLLRTALSNTEQKFGADHPNTAYQLMLLGQSDLGQKHYGDAEANLKRAIAIDERNLGPDDLMLANALFWLNLAYQREGRRGEALAASGRAVEVLTRRYSHAPRSSGGGTEQEQRQRLFYFTDYIGLLHAENQPGSLAESFRVAQASQASTTARAVAGMAARFAAGSSALADAVRKRQDLESQWLRLNAEMLRSASLSSEMRDAAADARTRAELDNVGRQIEAFDAELTRTFPAYQELSNPRPLELAAAQSLLGADEAMLVYLVGDGASWLFVLRHRQARLVRIEAGTSALAADVKALRSKLDPDLNPRLEPYDFARAHELYRKVVAPAAPLLEGAHTVFVVANGALESLPLGVLVAAEPPPGTPPSDANRRADWLVRHYAFSTLPSVGSLKMLRLLQASGPARAPFAGIGNPVLAGPKAEMSGMTPADLFRGALADVAAVRQLPPLPETALELQKIGKLMGAQPGDLFLAERAREPLVRAAGLDRYRVIDFATHGLVSGDLRGLAEPALVLTPPAAPSAGDDGLLTASKVATLKLNADLVVLSACNTAAPDGSADAGGLSGLAKAFFYAGARSLLVSHWPVPSDSTVELMTNLFETLRSSPSIGRAEALRRAEIAMIDRDGKPQLTHPMFWAAFVVAGEGGRGR